MIKTLLKSVLRDDLGKVTAQRGLLSDKLLYLFAEGSGEAVFASTSTLSESGTTGDISPIAGYTVKICHAAESPMKSLSTH